LVIPIESIAGMCDDLFRVFALGALYEMTTMPNEFNAGRRWLFRFRGVKHIGQTHWGHIFIIDILQPE